MYDRYILIRLSVLPLGMLSPASATDRVYLVDVAEHSIEVRISESFGQTTMVRAECTVPRDVGTIWGVLSDYENLDSLIPAVTESRILRQEEGRQILYQQGRVGLWVIKREFRVWFQVEEEPLSGITFRAIKGDFRRFEGSWTISAQQEGTRISHQVEIEPQFYAPQWAIRMVAVRLMQETIEAVVDRCLKGDNR